MNEEPTISNCLECEAPLRASEQQAEQLEKGRHVALKLLGRSFDDDDLRKRFLREGRLAAGVSHPNCVYIFGSEEIEGTPVIAMELVQGGTLRDLQKKRGVMPVREAVDITLQIVAGLEAAASAGVLLRDIKPANCFVSTDGTVKVGDFGLSVSTLARQESQITQSGVMLGTPSFAAPEQLRGEELDERADIFPSARRSTRCSQALRRSMKITRCRWSRQF